VFGVTTGDSKPPLWSSFARPLFCESKVAKTANETRIDSFIGLLLKTIVPYLGNATGHWDKENQTEFANLRDESQPEQRSETKHDLSPTNKVERDEGATRRKAT
jgi:hypothetical protein